MTSAARGGRGGSLGRQVRGLLRYIAFGRQHEQAAAERDGADAPAATPRRGTWWDQRGEPQPHAEVLAWAQAKVRRLDYGYGYQLLLSTRTGDLPTDGFNQALQAGSGVSGVQEWRGMVHNDTAHRHAHVVLFRREKLTKAEYRAWQQVMQGELERLQAQRQLELAQKSAAQQSAAQQSAAQQSAAQQTAASVDAVRERELHPDGGDSPHPTRPDLPADAAADAATERHAAPRQRGWEVELC